MLFLDLDGWVSDDANGMLSRWNWRTSPTKRETYEDYLGCAAWNEWGRKNGVCTLRKSRKTLKAALEADYVVLAGKQQELKKPAGTRLGAMKCVLGASAWGEIAKHDKNGLKTRTTTIGAGKNGYNDRSRKERMDGKDMGAPSRRAGQG